MATYINSIKVKENKFGLKVSGKLSDIVEELKKHTNEKGYINLEFFKRKEPGKYGDTHGVKLDDWKPNGEKGGSSYNQDVSKSEAPKEVATTEDDDLPF